MAASCRGGIFSEDGRGVLSILGLSHEIAVSEALDAQSSRHAKVDAAISGMKSPEGRGTYVDLPGPKA